MTEFGMGDVISVLLLIAAIVLIGLVIAQGVLKRLREGAVTVYDYEAGLKYVGGKLVEAPPPGFYRKTNDKTLIERVDLREVSLTIAGQEVLSKDNMPVRVTVIVRWKIADPIVYKRASANPSMRLYEAAQVLLRKRIGALDLDAILADRTVIDLDAATDLQAELDGAGMTILGFDMRDVTLVGVAKQAYADLWRAQKEGLAALERARGEQAALRALANAARMLKGNPELMNLRVLQALQGQQGKASPTVILGGAPGLVPVSKDAAPESPE
ncbi:MAG: SPFH domain-containing protein [Alphaproteobacteria bacterium]|nr:SPFH domain-containing protein [Alphaproteobacteria bacterium]